VADFLPIITAGGYGSRFRGGDERDSPEPRPLADMANNF